MVKEIELTQGQVTLVDDEDFDYLNQWKWCASFDKKISGYYVLRIQYLKMVHGKQKNKNIPMHRTIMERKLGRKLKPDEKVDHINHNSLKNTRDNLRVVSNRQNLQNQKRKTSSKYPGVTWTKQHKKWRARIVLKGKSKHLGYFDDEREAAKAYEKACRELCGEELVCKTESEGIK